MIIYPYLELLRRMRKGQNTGINTVIAIVILLAGVFIFIAILYYMADKGKSAVDIIDPSAYNN